jgi:hypothetical protein
MTADNKKGDFNPAAAYVNLLHTGREFHTKIKAVSKIVLTL